MDHTTVSLEPLIILPLAGTLEAIELHPAIAQEGVLEASIVVGLVNGVIEAVVVIRHLVNVNWLDFESVENGIVMKLIFENFSLVHSI